MSLFFLRCLCDGTVLEENTPFRCSLVIPSRGAATLGWRGESLVIPRKLSAEGWQRLGEGVALAEVVIGEPSTRRGGEDGGGHAPGTKARASPALGVEAMVTAIAAVVVHRVRRQGWWQRRWPWSRDGRKNRRGRTKERRKNKKKRG